MRRKKEIIKLGSRAIICLFFMLFTAALQAETKFNMGNDAPAPDGFRPIYTLYIFAGMFAIGIGAYFLLKYFNQDARKKVGTYDPSRVNQKLHSGNRKTSPGSKNSRRRSVVRKKVNVKR